MRGYYMQVENYIKSTYPEFNDNNISGSTYPPSQQAQMTAYLTNIVWLSGILLLFGGSFIFKTIGIEEPGMYVAMKENPVASFVCLFVINSVGASQLSTGAFEIKLNDIVIFSKLEQRRLPNLGDIVAALAAHGFRES